jgi:hypothetical protein
VQVLAVAIVVSVIAPLITGWVTNRLRRAEKREEWERQDAREAAERHRQEEVARRLQAEQERIREAADRAADEAAIDRAATASQLMQIHTLVNSDMTAARQELLDQTRLLVNMYRRTIEEEEAAGRTPLPDDVKALADAVARAEELQGILADRLAQQRIVEKEQKEQADAVASDKGGQ